MTIFNITTKTDSPVVCYCCDGSRWPAVVEVAGFIRPAWSDCVGCGCWSIFPCHISWSKSVVGLHRIFRFLLRQLLRLRRFRWIKFVTARFLAGASSSKLANSGQLPLLLHVPREATHSTSIHRNIRFVTVSCFDFAIMKPPRSALRSLAPFKRRRWPNQSEIMRFEQSWIRIVYGNYSMLLCCFGCAGWWWWPNWARADIDLRAGEVQ